MAEILCGSGHNSFLSSTSYTSIVLPVEGKYLYTMIMVLIFDFPLGHHTGRDPTGLGQYNGRREYCGPHTALSVFLILIMTGGLVMSVKCLLWTPIDPSLWFCDSLWKVCDY